MAAKNEKKILRIGIIQSGTIVEERLLRKQGDITVGQDVKSTFVVSSPGFTGKERVFQYKNGRYFLSFDEGMSGRINVRNEVRDLEDIRESETAKRQGGRWQIALDESCRGKVVVGSVTVLFQFVTPPAHEVSRPQLPVTVRRGLLTNLDMALVGMIALSLVVQLSTAIGLHYSWETKWQYQDVQQKANVRSLLRMEVAEVEDKEKEPEKEDKKKDEEKEDETEETEEKEIVEVEKPKKLEKIRKSKEREKAKTKKAPKKLTVTERRNRVRQASALRFVTAEGPGGALKDTLEKGVTARDIEAFDNLGVRVADTSEESRYRSTVAAAEGETKSYRLDEDDLRGPKAGKVEKNAAKKQTKIRGNVLLSGKVKTKGGRLDKNGVASAIKRRKTAIRRCYEEALRSDEGVGGKLLVEFTVGPRGRVTSSRVVKNTTKSSAVGACLLRRLGQWRFPVPEDGNSVTVRYPFVFSRKN